MYPSIGLQLVENTVRALDFSARPSARTLVVLYLKNLTTLGAPMCNHPVAGMSIDAVFFMSDLRF